MESPSLQRLNLSTDKYVAQTIRMHSLKNMDFDRTCYARSTEFVWDNRAFFHYHVLPALPVTSMQMQRLRDTETYELCRSIVSGHAPVVELTENCKSTIGCNSELIVWALSAFNEVETYFSRPTYSASMQLEIKSHLFNFDKLFQGEIPGDKSTCVLVTWWLTQYLEIASMTDCINLATPNGKNKISPYISECFSYFQKSTIDTVYLLTGDYCYCESWIKLIASLNSDSSRTKVSQKVTAAFEKSRSLAQNVRKLVHDAKKSSHKPTASVSLLPSSTLYDQLFQEMLLEPRYGLASGIAQLCIKHDDEEIGRSLIRYLGAENHLLPFMNNAICREVSSTNTYDVLFREDSLSTKLMSILFFSPQGGQVYLQKVVQPLISEIDAEWRHEDVDVTEEATLQQISNFCDGFLRRIYRCTHIFPHNVRVLLSVIQREVARKFPSMKQRVVGAFLFLRFLCPSLLNPKRYNLNPGSVQCHRVLLLISKILQQIANGSIFDPSKGVLCQLNNLIDNNLERLHAYFDILATVSMTQFEPSEFLKENVQKDFNAILANAQELKGALKGVVQADYPDSYSLLIEFLRAPNPNVLKDIADESDYGKKVRGYMDLLSPTTVSIFLSPEGGFRWHKERLEHGQAITSILQTLETKDLETKKYLHHMFELHSLAAETYSYLQKNEADISEAIVQRKLLLLSYMHKQSQSPSFIHLPDLIEVMASFNSLVNMCIELALVDGVKGSTSGRAHVRDALSILLVHLRWTVTQVVILQRLCRVYDARR